MESQREFTGNSERDGKTGCAVPAGFAAIELVRLVSPASQAQMAFDSNPALIFCCRMPMPGRSLNPPQRHG
jgi:hypothetical protein